MFYYHFDCRGQESCLSTFPQDGRAWQGHAKKVNRVWLVSGALNTPDMLMTGRLHAIFSVKLSEEAWLLDFLLLLGILCYSELIQNGHTPYSQAFCREVPVSAWEWKRLKPEIELDHLYVNIKELSIYVHAMRTSRLTPDATRIDVKFSEL